MPDESNYQMRSTLALENQSYSPFHGGIHEAIISPKMQSQDGWSEM